MKKYRRPKYTSELYNGADLPSGLVAVREKQPPETGDYEITRDGKKYWKCHFDTYFGWARLLNPEMYYWRKCI